MHALELHKKALRELAASTHGQNSEVRTIMGRQLHLMSNVSKLFLLPHLESDQLQNLDPTDPDFGTFLFMVGFDPVDGGAPIA